MNIVVIGYDFCHVNYINMAKNTLIDGFKLSFFSSVNQLHSSAAISSSIKLSNGFNKYFLTHL